MNRATRILAASALALTVPGCSVSGLLGGGGVAAPATLQTLTPEAADPGPMTRAATAGQAVTVEVPAVAKELRTVRVPVQVSPTDIQYVTGLVWVDTPDRLFQRLVSETVRRTTNRVVLDSGLTGLDPGVVLSGQLQKFGYDAQSGQVVVEYDGALSTAGGNRVDTRRFVATAPANGTAASVGPALNRAANQVAADVAKWIGG
ncbi:MAG TPA: ABC-type transport auxiliary lipoprotein family protein [Sphingomicrobium sp.]|nr:ABC-type transport auxiliary lipoprotein family protein [Sphingomicrobium sp.]